VDARHEAGHDELRCPTNRISTIAALTHTHELLKPYGAIRICLQTGGSADIRIG